MKNKYQLVLFTLLVLSTVYVIAQPSGSGGAQIMGAIETEAQTVANSTKTIVNYILGAVCAIGLIGVIWTQLTDNPKKKEAIIGFFVALIIWGIAFALI